MKQRLVGAIVLVAIAVAFVPAILDGPEPESDRRTTTLELPVPEENVSGDPVRRVQTVRLEPQEQREGPPEVRPATAARTAADQSQPSAKPADAKPAAKRAPQKLAAAPASPPAATSDTWYVQLGSFGELGNAQRLAQEAKSDGFEAQISTIVASGKTMHRVRVGPVATREKAESLRQSLAAKGQPGKLATGS